MNRVRTYRRNVVRTLQRRKIWREQLASNTYWNMRQVEVLRQADPSPVSHRGPPHDGREWATDVVDHQPSVYAVGASRCHTQRHNDPRADIYRGQDLDAIRLSAQR